MTRDYAKPSTTRNKTPAGKRKPAKKRPSARRSPPPPPPPKRGKLVVVLALLLLAFGAGIYSLQKIPATDTPLEAGNADSKAPAKNKTDNALKNEAAQTKAAPEQRFKFYDLLEESEVIAPKVDTYTFKEKNKHKDYYYLVQTGSFRSSADAERQKATIAFQGLKATIKPVQNQQGSTWYRVMTGPFHTRTEMNSALDKLVALQIEPLVKKVNK